MDETADRYFLSRRAYVCVLKNRMVVLDVSSGKYLALDAACAHSLSKHIEGWPRIDSQAQRSVGGGNGLELLLKRRLVTKDPALGKHAGPVEIRTPTRWIGELRPGGGPRFNAGHVLRF